MNKVYVVFESPWRGKFISAVFENEQDAKKYLTEVRGEDYSFDSACEYFMQEWGVR
jgi:hypothetical protein